MDVPQGALLSISVDPGATLPHNTKISVTLSQGPKPVTMPDIVGKTQDERNRHWMSSRSLRTGLNSSMTRFPKGK